MDYISAHVIAALLQYGYDPVEVVVVVEESTQMELLFECRDDQMVVDQELFLLAASLQVREGRVFPGGEFVCEQVTLPSYAHLEPG